MPSEIKRVQRHYDNNPEHEWERLSRHRTEFAVTLRALQEYLPVPPVLIADIGGGPGRYSIALTKLGYNVTLVDLSQNCLDLAKNKAIEEGIALKDAIQANALDLSTLPDNNFDAVLLMGPLYHLHDEDERRQAIMQAMAKLKLSGLFCAAFVARHAVLRYIAKNEPDWMLNHPEQFQTILETGKNTGEGFPNSYFAHPTEIVPLMESCGLKTLNLIACEGVVSMIEEQINELHGDLWDTWVDINYRLSRDPSIHGAAEHLLYVGKKNIA